MPPVGRLFQEAAQGDAGLVAATRTEVLQRQPEKRCAANVPVLVSPKVEKAPPGDGAALGEEREKDLARRVAQPAILRALDERQEAGRGKLGEGRKRQAPHGEQGVERRAAGVVAAVLGGHRPMLGSRFGVVNAGHGFLLFNMVSDKLAPAASKAASRATRARPGIGAQSRLAGARRQTPTEAKGAGRERTAVDHRNPGDQASAPCARSLSHSPPHRFETASAIRPHHRPTPPAP